VVRFIRFQAIAMCLEIAFVPFTIAFLLTALWQHPHYSAVTPFTVSSGDNQVYD
jgi:hypothetical protein